MKQKIICLMLVMVLMMSAVVPAAAYTQQQTADALNELGLFLGMGSAGYALDQNLTRAQGITLLVRMIGKESEAQDGTFLTPFVDVPGWAEGYVGYAYNHKITNGMSADKFGTDVQLNDYMFLTLVLRALGYSDSGETPAFKWNDPYALAYEVGLIREARADASFTRGDAVEVFWAAMHIEMVGKNMTLAESLIEQEIFTTEEFEAAEEIWKNGRADSEEESSGPELETPDQGGDEPDTPEQDGDQPEIPSQPEDGGNPEPENPDSGNNGADNTGDNETPALPRP